MLHWWVLVQMVILYEGETLIKTVLVFRAISGSSLSATQFKEVFFWFGKTQQTFDRW